MNKRKIISIVTTISFFIFLYILLFPSNFKVKLCDDTIKVEVLFKEYLKKENLLDKTCEFQRKIMISNEFTYLDSIYIMNILKSDDFVLEGLEHYAKIIFNSNSKNFVQYFQSLDKNKQFEILTFIKLSKERNKKSIELIKQLEEIYKENKQLI